MAPALALLPLMSWCASRSSVASSSPRCGLGTMTPWAAAAPAPGAAVTGDGATRTGAAIGHRRGCTPRCCLFPLARICYCAPRNPSTTRQGSVAAPTDPRRPTPSDAARCSLSLSLSLSPQSHSHSAPHPAPGRVGCGVRGGRGQPCRAVFLGAFLILHLLR